MSDINATAIEVRLVDHERRITLLERVDAWSIRALLFLAVLRFFGFSSLNDILQLFESSGTHH